MCVHVCVCVCVCMTACINILFSSLLQEGEVDGSVALLERLTEREQRLKEDIKRLQSILHNCSRDTVAMVTNTSRMFI